jgi:hypothetical protein
MRPPSSRGLLALCALLAIPALARESKAPRRPAASTRRTIQLGPESTIQYFAEPGDERSEGTLSVLPTAPSVERGPAAEEPNQPSEEERTVLSARATSAVCNDLHAKLTVRLLQLRGFDVDEVSAPWIWQRISVFGEELPLSALQSDSAARNLAIELAQCEATAGAR